MTNSAFLGTLYAQLAVNTTALDHASVKMLQFSRAADTALTSVQAKLMATGGAMKTFGRSMTQYLTLPMALVGGASVKMYRDFEFSMNKVVSLVGVARKQVDEWSKEVLALAPSLGKSPKELADAMYFITSAGIRGKETMEVLTESARSSAGGLGEVKVVADLLTSAVNAYGKENLSAARANDILVATVREGKAEADLLAQSMGLVLPIASAMGASFVDVGAATAAMTRTGTKAATAAIQLRQIFNSLLKPAKEAEQALVDMHTSSDELRRIIREDGLLAALEKLKDISEEYGIEAIGKIIPNIRSLTGVLDIMGKNVEANRKIFKAIEDSFGDANKLFEDTAHTVKFRLNAAFSEIQVSMVTFGETLSGIIVPIVEKVAKVISGLIKYFDNLSDTSKKVIVVIGLIVAAVGPLVTILGFLVGNVGPGLIMVFRGFNKIIAATAVRMAALNVVMLANPIGLLVAGIATLVAMYTLYLRKIKLVAKVRKELDEFGVDATEEEIRRWSRMSEIERKKEMWARREAEIEKERQMYFGKTTTVLEKNEELAKKILTAPAMNVRQLEETAQQLETQRIAIEDDILRLQKVKEVDISAKVELELLQAEENKKKMQMFFDNFLAEAQQQANSKVGIISFPNIVADTAQTFGTIEEISDSTFTEIGKSLQKYATTDSLLFIDTNKDMAEATEDYIAKLKKQDEGLETAGAVIAAALEDARKETEKTAKSMARANIEKELSTQFAGIVTMGKLLWNEMDVLDAKTGALSTALKSLAELGVSPLDAKMQEYVKQLTEAEKRSDLLKDSTINLTEAMSDLQHELAVAGMLASTFPEFLPGTKEFSQFSDWLDEPQKKLALYKQTLETLIAKKAKIQIEIESATGLPFDEGFELGIGDTNLDYLIQQFNQVEAQTKAVTDAVKQYQVEVDTITYDELKRGLEEQIKLIKDKAVAEGDAYGVSAKIASAWSAAWLEAMQAVMDPTQYEKFAKEATAALQTLTYTGISEAVQMDLDAALARFEATGNAIRYAKDQLNIWTNVVEMLPELKSKLDPKDYEELFAKATKAAQDAQEDIDDIKIGENLLESLEFAARQVQALFSSMGSLYDALMQKEIAAAEKTAKGKHKSEKWLLNEREKIEKEYAKKKKRMMIGEAIAGTALAIINALQTKPFWAALVLAGVAAVAGGIQIAAIRAAPMAEGGIVPPGYPKDTYPALLTSGEKVIPARASRQEQISGEVVFRIEGTELVGVLKKQMSLDSNY